MSDFYEPLFWTVDPNEYTTMTYSLERNSAHRLRVGYFPERYSVTPSCSKYESEKEFHRISVALKPPGQVSHDEYMAMNSRNGHTADSRSNLTLLSPLHPPKCSCEFVCTFVKSRFPLRILEKNHFSSTESESSTACICMAHTLHTSPENQEDQLSKPRSDFVASSTQETSSGIGNPGEYTKSADKAFHSHTDKNKKFRLFRRSGNKTEFSTKKETTRCVGTQILGTPLNDLVRIPWSKEEFIDGRRIIRLYKSHETSLIKLKFLLLTMGT